MLENTELNFDELYELEMATRMYEEGVGIELYNDDETPDEVWEPEYLGDR